MKRQPSKTALPSAPSSAGLTPPPDAADNDDEEGEDAEGEDEDDDDFGDDFDDFEEGAEADGDFDDFEDGFQEPEFQAPAPALAPSLPQVPALPFVSTSLSKFLMTFLTPQSRIYQILTA